MGNICRKMVQTVFRQKRKKTLDKAVFSNIYIITGILYSL